MGQTLTTRVKAIKNDNLENVLVAELNAALDKFDNHFIPACKIRNSNQSIATGGGTVALQYSNTTIDTYAARTEGPMADLVNDRIVIRKAGLYLIKSNVLWLAGTAAGILRSNLSINGTVNNAVFDPGVAVALSQAVTSVELLAVNDIITASCSQTTGVARSVDNNTYDNIFELSAVWLGGGIEV